MSKGGLALSSLVMAIPAGLMAYLSIRSVFEMNEKMPVLVTVIVWALIILGVLIAISPIIFLIAGPKGAVADPAPAADDIETLPVADTKKKPAKQESDDDEFAADDGDSEDDEQLFDTSNDEAADDFEDNFDFDEGDDEEEEEPAPKKKKKK